MGALVGRLTVMMEIGGWRNGTQFRRVLVHQQFVGAGAGGGVHTREGIVRAEEDEQEEVWHILQAGRER